MTGFGSKGYPKTLQEAVERLLKELPSEDKDRLKVMNKDELFKLHPGLGMRIRNNMGLHEEDSALMKDCCPDEYMHKGLMPGFSEDDCSMVIIEALWRRLKEDEEGPEAE